MIENWKPVVGYEGRYEVSDLGRVRSILRRVTAGHGHRLVGGQLVSQHLRKITRTYAQYTVTLSIESRTSTRKVHTLVLEAFHGPRPPNFVGRHLSGDSLDNRAVNLKWGTREENVADMVLHGHTSHGERNNHAKLSASDVLLIRGDSRKAVDIARAFNVTRITIDRIKQGQTWRREGAR